MAKAKKSTESTLDRWQRARIGAVRDSGAHRYVTLEVECDGDPRTEVVAALLAMELAE